MQQFHLTTYFYLCLIFIFLKQKRTAYILCVLDDWLCEHKLACLVQLSGFVFAQINVQQWNGPRAIHFL